MANKTWTATDIKMGTLTLTLSDDNQSILTESTYTFLDNTGNNISGINGRITLVMKLNEIPTNVLSALQTINTWRKQKALEQEGMT